MDRRRRALCDDLDRAHGRDTAFQDAIGRSPDANVFGPPLHMQAVLAKGYLARQAGLTPDSHGIPMRWIWVAILMSMIIILFYLFASWAGNHASEIAAL